MHVLYVHQNFPAQFGHLAARFVADLGWRCTFVSDTAPHPPGDERPAGMERIRYSPVGGATVHNHYCTRTFENAIRHCDGVFRALLDRPDVRPDLIVGHSGFGSTLFLRELFPDVPVVNLFEYYYRPHDPESDMTFRRDLAALGWTNPTANFLRSRARNAMLLLDLQNCQAGYCPTEFQRSRFPDEYLPKLRTIFDGIDRTVWNSQNDRRRAPDTPRQVAGVEIPAGTRLVTYVSRGFESMRGFDRFMAVAKRVAGQYPDVRFVVVGTDQVAYGGDEHFTGGKSFLRWTLDRDAYDLSRFHFVGRLPSEALADLLAASDLHLYFTVPFVLSWSLMNAMACGTVVLAGDTAPVREMVRDGHTGLLADFFDTQALADRAVEVLRDPQRYRDIGRSAERQVDERYSVDAVLPAMIDLYRSAAARTDPATTNLEVARPDTHRIEPMPSLEPVTKRSAARPSRLAGVKRDRRTPFNG